MMERQEIPVIICFNKKDIADEPEIESLEKTYEACGYRVIFASAREGENILEIKEALKGKTTTVAGPSGVGKSSLINCLQENVNMETGSISKKIARGKHTTRHSELITIDDNSYIMDTPGFSSLYVNEFEKEELKYEFKKINIAKIESIFSQASIKYGEKTKLNDILKILDEMDLVDHNHEEPDNIERMTAIHEAGHALYLQSHCKRISFLRTRIVDNINAETLSSDKFST